MSGKAVDLFVIGGGINGCGIARDAAGRGLSVMLAEMNDLAAATSSSSTKLFHGGLRYLEFFEFRLVREALIERETLLRAMPHIAWPLRFVLPFHPAMRFETETPASKVLSFVMPWMKGRRPAWLIRLGLFLYDHMGGRDILPATQTLPLRSAPEGIALHDRFEKAFEYSDCWVEDSRLVVLNARDAEARGATIRTRTKVTSAQRTGELWQIELEDQVSGDTETVYAHGIVNAGGPWVENIVRNVARINASESVRLVRGSHIVTKKLFDHNKAYFFQGEDGRIIFAIPYETDFTLIGTTDHEHEGAPGDAICTPQEQDYLCAFASNYFKKPVTRDDIVWTYSGVRPLYDDGAKSATAATRDYVLSLSADSGPPILNVFGGKITTYRRLAESAMAKLEPFYPHATQCWTAGEPLPGGGFGFNELDALYAGLRKQYPFLGERWLARLVRAYGDDTENVLGIVDSADDLGIHFGADLTEAEVRWLMEREYARTAHDVVWRRSKLGLRLSSEQIESLDQWMQAALQDA